MVNQCYLAYLKGFSCRQIGERIWQRLELKSAESAGDVLYREFKLACLPTRSKGETIARYSYRHGHGRRAARARKGGEGAYRRWLKTTTGRYNPPCEHPGCKKPAMTGDLRCWSHSDATAGARVAIAANNAAAFKPKRASGTRNS